MFYFVVHRHCPDIFPLPLSSLRDLVVDPLTQISQDLSPSDFLSHSSRLFGHVPISIPLTYGTRDLPGEEGAGAGAGEAVTPVKLDVTLPFSTI